MVDATAVTAWAAESRGSVAAAKIVFLKISVFVCLLIYFVYLFNVCGGVRCCFDSKSYDNKVVHFSKWILALLHVG